MVAALYVEPRGVYAGLPGVDPWDEARDARTYAGPHPVVAHPPCERWGRYHGGAPLTWPRLQLGADGGCFAAALHAVRIYGGVLEHPEGSHAWRWMQLTTPPRGGGLGSGGLARRLDVLRRAGLVRPSRSQGDVVVRRWRRAAAVPELGFSTGRLRAARRWVSFSGGAAASGQDGRMSAALEAAAYRHARAVPRPAAVDRSQRLRGEE